MDMVKDNVDKEGMETMVDMGHNFYMKANM